MAGGDIHARRLAAVVLLVALVSSTSVVVEVEADPGGCYGECQGRLPLERANNCLYHCKTLKFSEGVCVNVQYRLYCCCL